MAIPSHITSDAPPLKAENGRNDTPIQHDFSCNTTLHQQYHAIAHTYPNRIAVTQMGHTMNHKTLNETANQWAHYLITQYRIQPNTRVVLCMEKTPYLLIAILAVLKAGGVYVPVGGYPPARITYIIKDTQPVCILTDRASQPQLQETTSLVPLVMDAPHTQNALSHAPLCPPPSVHAASPNDTAYIIYTSGTTGQPNGVPHSHRDLLTLFESATTACYDFYPHDVWLWLHATTFDFSLWEMWGALLYGSKLVIPHATRIQDMRALLQLCQQERVSVLNQTPQQFYALLHAMTQATDPLPHLTTLRYIIFGGERLDFRRLTPWFDHYDSHAPLLVNMYGITETTVHTTYKIITHTDSPLSLIGRALPHQTLYLLDTHLRPVPTGDVGEIYVGGQGLAEKYINQPALTAARFLPSPFPVTQQSDQHHGHRLYKTGDLGREHENGEIEYLGRQDTQVKIRGYRINCEEIAQCLQTCPNVAHAIVRSVHTQGPSHDYTHTNPPPTLVAYCVLHPIPHNTVNTQTLAAYIATRLPHYMHPMHYIILPNMPLTRNGKIDLHALPLPDIKNTPPSPHYPTNNIEAQICAAFSTVLDLDTVGINDNFFALGGDSLKVVNLVATLQKHFSLQVMHVFQSPTPCALAQQVKNEDAALFKRLHGVIQHYAHPVTPLPLLSLPPLPTSATYALPHIAPPQETAILLTGATGYLGSYLLHALLHHTPYSLYVLARPSGNQTPTQRLISKHAYYFKADLRPFLHTRIQVLCGDLENVALGLSHQEYTRLSQDIAHIVHAAAWVQHYGHPEHFHTRNVVSTERLLSLAKTAGAHFHHISTTAVCHAPPADSTMLTPQTVYTEANDPLSLSTLPNPYVRSKHQAECAVVRAQADGVHTSLYRVGNLALDTHNGSTQENAHDNAFLHCFRYLCQLRCLTPPIEQVAISPVNDTAHALIRLIQDTDCRQEKSHKHAIYHVFNPYRTSMIAVFQDLFDQDFSLLPLPAFMKKITTAIAKHDANHAATLRFLLHQGWLDGQVNPQYGYSGPRLSQERTQQRLYQLGFTWSPIAPTVFRQYYQQYVKCVKNEKV